MASILATVESASALQVHDAVMIVNSKVEDQIDLETPRLVASKCAAPESSPSPIAAGAAYQLSE